MTRLLFHARRAAALAVAAAIATACAPGQRVGTRGDPSGAPSGVPAGVSAGVGARAEAAPDDLGAIMLHIDNRGWDDMRIIVVRGNLSDRIGSVTSAGRWSVALDKWIEPQGSLIQLVAQPLGTRPYGAGAQARTQLLLLKPGQTVLWTIEKDLARSFVEVR